jgi:hypothetical protein
VNRALSILAVRQRVGVLCDNTGILEGKDWSSNLMHRTAHLSLRTPEGLPKARAAAINRYVVDNFYKIYFELVAEFGIGEKPEA